MSDQDWYSRVEGALDTEELHKRAEGLEMIPDIRPQGDGTVLCPVLPLRAFAAGLPGPRALSDPLRFRPPGCACVSKSAGQHRAPPSLKGWRPVPFNPWLPGNN